MTLNRKVELAEAVIAVIGVVGSDGGYSVVTGHGVVHVPGNNPMAHLAAIASHASMLADRRMGTAIGEIVGPALRAALARDLGANREGAELATANAG